jgi:hypothetical protein
MRLWAYERYCPMGPMPVGNGSNWAQWANGPDPCLTPTSNPELVFLICHSVDAFSRAPFWEKQS